MKLYKLNTGNINVVLIHFKEEIYYSMENSVYLHKCSVEELMITCEARRSSGFLFEKTWKNKQIIRNYRSMLTHEGRHCVYVRTESEDSLLSHHGHNVLVHRIKRHNI